ncbi:hypothetical protein ACVWYF_004135 [Hymenobacter sp. UYAg731]
MNRHLLAFLFLLAAHVTGCRTSHPVDERGNAGIVPLAANHATTLHDSLPNRVSPAPFTRFTDAIGLSTYAGRARRQVVKLARATIPRKIKIGKGGQYAPLATVALNAGNKGGPIAHADSGATLTQTVVNKNKAALAAGPNATATQTTVKPGFPWLKVGGAVGGVLLLVLLFGTPVGGWLVAAVVRRKSSDSTLS